MMTGHEVDDWLCRAGAWFRQHSVVPDGRGGTGVCYTDLIDFLRNSTPPPPSLCEAWENRVWNLQDEPLILYYLRCLASSLGGARGCVGIPFVVSAAPFLPFPDPQPAACTRGVLQRRPIRVIALRLVPAATDIIQIGWHSDRPEPSATERLQPTFCSRTHFVIQMIGSAQHFSAWAYGDIGMQMRVGEVLCAVLHESEVGDGGTAYVIHSVVSCTDTQEAGQPLPNCQAPAAVPLSPASVPCGPSFKQLLDAFAPEIAEQKLCKSLLLLVGVHTVYRAIRCRDRQPLHMLLLGSPRSGKSALLRALLQLLGPCATLISAHVVRGRQRSATLSQLITAACPRVQQQLLVGGAVSTVDSLLIDELVASSGSTCTNQVEGLLNGLCSINGNICAGSGAANAYGVLSGSMLRTRAQITVAASDDHLGMAGIVPRFSIVARTTANLSLRSAALISGGVIAASVARSESSSVTRLRSTSLSSGVSGCASFPRPAESSTLHAVVMSAPSSAVLEAAIPVDAFTQFYLRRLLDYHGSRTTDGITVLATQLAVLWELNIARLTLDFSCSAASRQSDCDYSSCATPWSESLAEDVWLCYKHHLLAVDTARLAIPSCQSARTLGIEAATSSSESLIYGEAAYASTPRPPGGRAKRRRGGKKGACLALLRRMSMEQRARGGTAVQEEVARRFFDHLGGEDQAGLSFVAVMDHLLDAGLVIRRHNAYSVVGEA
uniref:Uncharacterized protein TCIL3000_10_6350 n=1 Tax=Trypanosoma congolense (strain IL3000) TaxID=1068625 RepID=G0UWU5_TRYCI|nr:unnamed protein product [Trypanosoma congolense IL3000]